MKSYRTNAGPFSERPYYSNQEIETICVDELKAAGLFPSAPEPIRIDRFIEKRFKITPTYEDLGTGVLGLTRFGESGVQEVVVSKVLDEEGSAVAERRIRTTLAHEAGHGLLHAHLFVTECAPQLFGDYSDPKHPKVLCRDEDGLSTGSYNGKWWEYQANRAIGALLLPRSILDEALRRYLKAAGSLGLPSLDRSRFNEAVQEISKLFNVNPMVAKIRLNELFPAEPAGQLRL